MSSINPTLGASSSQEQERCIIHAEIPLFYLDIKGTYPKSNQYGLYGVTWYLADGTCIAVLTVHASRSVHCMLHVT